MIVDSILSMTRALDLQDVVLNFTIVKRKTEQETGTDNRIDEIYEIK